MSSEGCSVFWWVCTAIGVFYVGKWTLYFLCGIVTFLRVFVGSRLWKRNLVEEYGGKWAVVTGSTDGIGKEYARQLAQRGMNIVLISRTLEKLKKVAEEIKKEFGVETHIIAADFSTGRQIYDGIANGLKDKDIGILVNNVGYFGPRPQKFNEITEDDVWRTVFTNTTSVVAMTKIVLPQMLDRKRGAIVNISSIVAVRPFPMGAVYCATKSFVTFFSKALEFEYRDCGLTVQVVEPGMVVTNMTSYAEYLTKPGFTKPLPNVVVSSALRSLGLIKVTAGNWDHCLQNFFMNGLNEELVLRIYSKVGEVLAEDAKKKTN